MTVQGLGDDDLLRSLVLDGKKLDARLIQSVTQDGPLRRSISEPSSLSLTLHDPERFLAQGGYYERRADLEVDDLWFRLIRAEKTGDLFTVEFTDREVVLLGRHAKPKRASRADVTRAEFLRSLVREEPHIPFVCPALHRRQEIADFSRADQRSLGRERARGIHSGAGVKVKGRPASPEQIENANTMLRAAQSVSAGARATLAMIAAAIVESELRNVQGQGADSISFGVLQNIPGRSACVDGTMTRERALNVGYTARSALQPPGPTSRGGLIRLARDNPGWSIGQLASAAINGGGDPQYVEKVDGRHDEAKAYLDAFGGVDAGPDSDTGGGAYVARYEYTRGQPGGAKGENTWECGIRHAEEVAWRWFCVAGVVYFISDYDLIRSMPRMALNERSSGVTEINWALDDGKRIPDTVTVSGRAGRWDAPPGTVVVLDSSMSPADGAWIVTEIERESLTNPNVTITLTRPSAPRLEPASQVATRDTGSDTADGGTNAGDVRGGARGEVSIAPGAESNGKLKQPLLDFLALVAGQTHEQIRVTTGTNHDKYTTSGEVSDHYTGNAADLGLGGDARSSPEVGSKGDNIATAALIVLGKSRGEAHRMATSGQLNFTTPHSFAWRHDGKTYRVQVGWRTLVGGNHYTHVHIGVA